MLLLYCSVIVQNASLAWQEGGLTDYQHDVCVQPIAVKINQETADIPTIKYRSKFVI